MRRAIFRNHMTGSRPRHAPPGPSATATIRTSPGSRTTIRSSSMTGPATFARDSCASCSAVTGMTATVSSQPSPPWAGPCIGTTAWIQSSTRRTSCSKTDVLVQVGGFDPHSRTTGIPLVVAGYRTSVAPVAERPGLRPHRQEPGAVVRRPKIMLPARRRAGRQVPGKSWP